MFLNTLLAGLGLGGGLLGHAYTAVSKPTVWLVIETPHGIVLAVCNSKRSAYLFRMRYMCEQEQERRNTTLMYGRVGSREHHREAHDNAFWAFRPTVSEYAVEVHQPPPHPTKASRIP